MKLFQLKEILTSLDAIHFQLENGTSVPDHFHVTEVGLVTKQFIDCGGTRRTDKTINLQLLNGSDYDHRLASPKLLAILEKSEKALNLEDTDIEVEYQSDTIGIYRLDFNGQHFVLVPKQTACLASDNCGTSTKEQSKIVSCAPGGGCC